MTQGDLPPLPPQHPGGFIWEPHAGRMRIVTDAEWGALADDLLPMVREAAAALANPLSRGANIHPMIVERAARLTELLTGEMDEVAARVPRVYMASLWLAEKYDTDRRLRGANDPMGEPLSDEMRAAMVDLMAVLPSFVRQFPKVLQIEADREDFFADALQLDAAERAATGAEEARLIAPEDAQPLTEGVAAARGEGPLADRAGRSVVRSLRNLASAGFVAGAVFGHVTGFVSGEIIGGIADGVGIEIRAPMGRWVRGRHEDIQTLFATAPPDLRIAIAQHVEALMDPGPIPAPPAQPSPKPRTWIVDPDPAKGDFTLIQPAIDAAADGDKVVVREGKYCESLRLSKAITMHGEGDAERIMVVADNGNAMTCDAPKAIVIGFSFGVDGSSSEDAVTISSGTIEFNLCMFSSQTGSGVWVGGKGTSASLKGCIVENCAVSGIFIMTEAEVLLEDCHISRSKESGIWVQGEGTRLVAKRCGSTKNAENGIFAGFGALIEIEDCIVQLNEEDGIYVILAEASIIKSRSMKNDHSGIFVHDSSTCTIGDSEVINNGSNGISVEGGSTVSVSGSEITGNLRVAISMHDADSYGTFQGNDLRGNARGPWDIAKGAKVIDEGNLT